jgi:hypothetical protein
MSIEKAALAQGQELSPWDQSAAKPALTALKPERSDVAMDLRPLPAFARARTPRGPGPTAGQLNAP